MTDFWIEIINNPNKPHKKRKRNKKNETEGNHFPTNQPIAHPTVNGNGIVGRLREKDDKKRKTNRIHRRR